LYELAISEKFIFLFMKKFLRFCLLLVVAFIAFGAVLYGWAVMLRPQLSTTPVAYSQEKISEESKIRDVSFDTKNPPTIQRDVAYGEGKAAAWYPKGEAPILAELVKEKKLPPVDERTGPEPLILDGVDGIGKYGGTWMRLANAPGDVGIVSSRLSGATLVRWSPMGYPIRPHLAKSWSVTPDRRVWTFNLRKGVNWSDGKPFTADDILYWWEDEANKIQSTPPAWMMVAGKYGKVVKVDQYTVQFIFPGPNGVFLESLCRYAEVYSPRHYFRKYHPDVGDQKLIKATMEARGLTTPRALYTILQDFRNPECPRMWPWVYRTYKSSAPEGFVRNPYFWAVDPQGNQLPYVDRMLFDVKSPRMIPLTAASGDATMQDRHISYDYYTLLMENRARNNFDVYHWFPAVRSMYTLWPNINRRVFPNDPITRQKALLLQDKRFRQALSIAINRKQIINALYNGTGEPAQIDPGRESPFHSEKLMKSFTEFDPQRANKMLDELGLTKRDIEGMRCFPAGERMTWYIDLTDFNGEGPVQFIVDDWAQVGIRAIFRERSRPLFTTEKLAQLHDFTVWTGESEFNPMVEPRSFVATQKESHYAQMYGVWYQKGGLYGNPAALKGGLEPPKGSPIRRNQEIKDLAQQAATQEEQVKIFSEALENSAENVWSISISTPPPWLTVVKKGFRNVPRNAICGVSYNTPANAGIETFYFEKDNNSPGAIAQIKREIITVTPPPDAINPDTLQQGSGGGGLARLVSFMIYGIFGLGLLMIAVRHPYIGRRMFIMIPTLLIISVVTFTIIQLPPGDFVETRVMELQATGDEAAIKEVERLREMFHLGDPGWKQYMRWMGLHWFVTFDQADQGLLQGNMGRSLETQKSVNDIVGDRVLLTFLVSLGTILFTWAVALPIGIYSAVRQYTWGDYLLTFIGFIGMCVPNFLLAIILMYWSGKYLGINVTGLFSPEYAAAPEWTWGKIVDMFKHVWVPIVVIATAGTAGMIRVMRGNLLDELRKPYVTTAMAKGVRPFRLLMKYPVRLALNPFISGIGGIFPQLISGGTIVAIVLSLPMVGPIMLQGLMTQDTYLAGSMLMVLSLLGIFGTLVSDILLLWLDPRIRMEGGSK
jgi:ABC-type dipeptide/oligopeptide/nickel transport system permease component/ABC-type transport system substrate-binding protein